MHAALRTTARVGPGRRLEIDVPELPEGEDVDVIIVLSRPASPAAPPDPRTPPPAGDADGDAEERAERERELTEFKANMNRWRADQGRPPLA